jgi:hypothetical protein
MSETLLKKLRRSGLGPSFSASLPLLDAHHYCSFVMWAFAWFILNNKRNSGGWFRSTWSSIEFVIASLMLLTGAFFFVAGTYTSIQSILDSCTSSPVILEVWSVTDPTLMLTDAKGASKHHISSSSWI